VSGKSHRHPFAEENSKSRQRTINLEQEMIRSRRIYLTGEINDDTAKDVIQKLLFFEAEDPSAPVTLFINSGGGFVHSGFAIKDMMAHVSTPVRTVAVGRCLSIAALVLAGGEHGQRFAAPSCRIMIHEPQCAYPKNTSTNLTTKINELNNTSQTYMETLSKFCRRPLEEVSVAVLKETYMSPAEGVEFGIIDGLFSPHQPPPDPPPDLPPDVPPNQPST